jgi:hypothetical protein
MHSDAAMRYIGTTDLGFGRGEPTEPGSIWDPLMVRRYEHRAGVRQPHRARIQNRFCSRPEAARSWRASLQETDSRAVGAAQSMEQNGELGPALHVAGNSDISDLSAALLPSRPGIRPGRAIPRASVDRLGATVSHAEQPFRLLKCPMSAAGRRPAIHRM